MINPNEQMGSSSSSNSKPLSASILSAIQPRSLLKQEIDAYHERYLLPVGKKVVEHFLRQFHQINEIEPITKFEAIICCEDDKAFWEEVVSLSDCDHGLLAEKVGVVMTFPKADECRVRWSGK